VLPVHPAAELFPMMSEAELRELGEDIKANGLRMSITLVDWPGSPVKADGKPVALLDGRNRLDALELTGHHIHFEDDCSGWPEWFAAGWNSDGKSYAVDLKLSMMVSGKVADTITDAYSYVISANIQRRQLTAEQKRELIAKVLKAKPEQSNLQIAKQVKSDDKTVAKVRKKLEATSEIPKLKKTVGKDGKERPTRKPKGEVKFAAPCDRRQRVFEQKVFDSPQEARAKAEDQPRLNKRDFEQLEQSWREVHAQIKAGNNSRLHNALEVHTVIARDILVRIRAKAAAS
jgi:hypothetical protein